MKVSGSSSRLAITATLLVLSAGSALPGRAPDAAENYWPAKTWRVSVPEDQGVDSQKLAAIFDAVQAKHIPIHSLTVIRNGFVVLDADFYPYSSATLHDLASMTKSVLATLVGIAADQGLLRLDRPVLEFFQERTFANTDDRKRHLTVEHLLTMTSGLCENTVRGEQELDEQRRSADWVHFALDRTLVSDPGQVRVLL